MNQLERWVVFSNAILAALSCFINAWVASRSTEPWRSVRIPISGLAGVYSVAYLWLFFTQNLGPWSSLMRGVSLLAWPVVWIRPALVNLRVVTLMRSVIERKNE